MNPNPKRDSLLVVSRLLCQVLSPTHNESEYCFIVKIVNRLIDNVSIFLPKTFFYRLLFSVQYLFFIVNSFYNHRVCFSADHQFIYAECARDFKRVEDGPLKGNRFGDIAIVGHTMHACKPQGLEVYGGPYAKEFSLAAALKFTG